MPYVHDFRGTVEEAFVEPEPVVEMPPSPIKAERKAVPKTTRARLFAER